MSAPARPPRWARRLLAAVAPAEDRAFLLDDLDEAFLARRARTSPSEARRWYRIQVATSVPPLAARRAALFVSRLRRPTMPLDDLRLDARFAIRSFLARPVFTLVAVATLALGVGATTAVFSLLDGALLGSVPGVTDPEGLVEISRSVDGERFDVAWPVFRELAREVPGLDGLAAVDWEPVSVAGSGEPRATLSLTVSAGYFDVLRLTPGRGRFFGPGEATPPTSAAVAVVSDHFWRERLGASSTAVGSTLRVNGVPVTVVGVGPPGFRGHTVVAADVFLPPGTGIPGLRSAAFLQGVENGGMELLGRLAPGATPRAVEAAASEVGDRLLAAERGAGPRTFRARVEPWGPVPASGRGAVSGFFALLMAVVGTVLLVACVNVAGMLLSRSAEREGEVAVRRALGAGRGRIARQLLTEGLLLFAAGGAGGVLLSALLVRLLLAFEPPLPPGFGLALEPRVDAGVLAFALGVTVLTALAFNVLPAMRAGRDLAAGGRAGGARRPSRARGVLVAAQVAGSVTLLATAGLFARSLASLRGLDTGWEAAGVQAVELDVALAGLDDVEGRRVLADVLERARSVPGVAAAGLAARLPLAGPSTMGDVTVPGVEPPPGRTGFSIPANRVTPGYLDALGLELREGRDLAASDDAGSAPVAVVGRAMATLLWPDRSAVGERFLLGQGEDARGVTVVGVVEDAAVTRLGGPPEPVYYVPWAQRYAGGMILLARAAPGAGAGLAGRLRAAARDAAPDLPLERVGPLDERLGLFFLPQRLGAWVAGMVGALALLLAAVGVYGLTAFAVARRLPDIGVRLALGAAPRTVVAGVLRRALAAPLAGTAVGLALAAGLARLAAPFLAGVDPGDPAAYAGAVAVLLAAATAAALLPAARAARTDPARSLRSE